MGHRRRAGRRTGGLGVAGGQAGPDEEPCRRDQRGSGVFRRLMVCQPLRDAGEPVAGAAAAGEHPAEAVRSGRGGCRRAAVGLRLRCPQSGENSGGCGAAGEGDRGVGVLRCDGECQPLHRLRHRVRRRFYRHSAGGMAAAQAIGSGGEAAAGANGERTGRRSAGLYMGGAAAVCGGVAHAAI